MKVFRSGIWLYFPLCLLFSVVQSQELDDSEGGGFLFFSNYEEVAENNPSGKGIAGSKQACEESVLTSFLTSLQVINPESVIALATKNKLENKCHNISRTIDNMENYLKTCSLELDQEQYINLLHGVKALYKKLCNKSPYHKSFMQHKKCYGELQSEVGDTCNGPADWCDSSDVKRVCRAYQEIRDCYYIKANVMCGNKAAEVLKDLVQCIIESVLTVNCTVIVTEEEFAKMSKEQKLILQKQMLGHSSGGAIETGSSRGFRLSPDQFLKLSTIFVTFMAKLLETIIQNLEIPVTNL